MTNQTARGRAYRRKMRQKARDRLLGMAGYMAYPRSVYVVRTLEDGKWRIIGKYPKHKKSSKVEAYHKRRSAKVVRHRKELPHRGNGYRKMYDYWWSID